MGDSEELDIKFDDLQITKTIGKGNFGKVYRGTYFGTDVAIKQLYYVDDEDMQKYIGREMATLKGLRHPNIVQLLGLCKDATGIFIVTEFIAGGDLKSKLKDPNVRLPWSVRVKIALDVAYAMSYLHSRKMIHRDLKSQNLLVCDDWKIKVCDFGFARKAEAKADYLTMCGTDEWMAPEVGLGEKYDARADVFSYGMILCELITRRKPPKRNPGRAYAFDVEALKARSPTDVPKELYTLCVDCAQFYPEKRPNMNAILQRLKALQERLAKEKPAATDEAVSAVTEPVYESSSEEEGDEGGSGKKSESEEEYGSGSEEEYVTREGGSDDEEEFSYGGVVVEVEDD